MENGEINVTYSIIIVFDSVSSNKKMSEYVEKVVLIFHGLKKKNQ